MSDVKFEVNSSENPNTTTFFCGGIETLRISDKGFWVRGRKVRQSDREARIVYNSFKEWLTWQHLDRR
jgi:hypothetical protein